MQSKSKNLFYFFLGTFLWTWLFYFPIAIFKLNWSSGPGLILFLAGGPAPAFMGIIMAYRTYSKKEFKTYLNRCYNIRRISLKWFLFPFILFPLLSLINISLSQVFGGTLPGMDWLKAIIANPVLILPSILLSLASGPLTEEFGWRGYALEPLLKKFGFIKGSIILGFIWGIWHLPWYFMPGQWHYQMGFALTGFWAFMLATIAYSIIFSFVYINTERSILSAFIVHMCANFFMSQLISPYSNQLEAFRCGSLLIVGLLIIIYVSYNKKMKTRLNSAAKQITMK